MSLLSNFIKFPPFKWLPFISLAVALYCILVLDFDFQHIIVLFVSEIVLVMIFALIRMLFAYDGLPPSKMVIEKIIWLVLGLSCGVFFVALSISILSKSFLSTSVFDEFRGVLRQISILFIGHVESLFSNFFRNNQYKTASPTNQMAAFIYVLTLLAFIQLFTIHLLPNYPMLNQAKSGIVALVIVKFCVDYFFNLFQNQWFVKKSG